MLTDAKVRALKPTDKTQKIRDDRGLFLVITPQGGKGWRFRYTYRGKEGMLSLGIYPDVSLAEARERRDEMRKQLAQGIDPSAKRKADRADQGNTFNALFHQWYATRKLEWGPGHAERNLRRYEIHAQPFIGELPVTEITPPVILDLLKRIQVAGTVETAHRVKGVLSGVFQYAIAIGHIQIDPTGGLSKAIARPPEKHYPAPLKSDEIGRILRLLWTHVGTPAVMVALKVGPYLFCRPGELRTMRWSEIDLDAGTWSRTLTKTGNDLVSPLPSQVIELLRWLHPITGHCGYVFPNARSPRGDRPMSEVAVLAAMRSLGINKDELVGHSFRAMARTIGDETLGFRPDVLEHALGHRVKDALGGAYNRTTFIDERRRFAQAWADWLDDQRKLPHSLA
jgi:integrase